ncbi:siderophore-interacting protein [Asanoa sp. NPDC050611]|uniref:siderophore-interacting protein n=1 Tax=Asanoa sp. NPDC050611 TaxID=3157098 RepID=UPI0033E89A81
MLDRHDELVRRLVGACRESDVAGLRAALDAGAVAVCDGGGLVPAEPGPVVGTAAVARLLHRLLCETDPDRPDAELTIESVNGRAGLALRRDGRAVAVVAVKVADTGMVFLWIVLSPAKLRRWHRR